MNRPFSYVSRLSLPDRPRRRSAVVLCLLAGLLLLPAMALGGIPEPDTLLYGKVFNTAGGVRFQMDTGAIEVVFADKENPAKRHTVAGELASLGGGDYSYILRIPHQARISASESPAAGIIALTDAERRFDAVSITVDGVPAAILPPARDFIMADQNSRSQSYRIDLEIHQEMTDTDGDGLPDWWEDRYGLNKFVADAHEDPDGDWWDNMEEFRRGADPTMANFIPRLLDDTVRAYRHGKSIFHLDIADADTFDWDLSVVLAEMPEGFVFYRVDDGGTALPLAPGEAVSLEEINTGRVILEHLDGADVAPMATVRMDDGEHEPVTAHLYITVMSPTATDGAEAVFWADAHSLADRLSPGGAVLPDLSGNGYDGTGWTEPEGETPDELELDELELTDATPTGKSALLRDGAGWLELPYGESVFPGGDATFFSVFKTTGANGQMLASGPHFEIGVTGADHPTHPGQVHLSSENAVVYGNTNIKDAWTILNATRQNGQSRIYLDGVWAGGPFAQPEVTALGTDPVIGAKNEWIWNFTDDKWQFDASRVFTGAIGEMLVFDRELPETKKWRIHAYLLSKWFGHVVGDFSDASKPVTFDGGRLAAEMALNAYLYDLAHSDLDGMLAALTAHFPEGWTWSAPYPDEFEVQAAFEELYPEYSAADEAYLHYQMAHWMEEEEAEALADLMLYLPPDWTWSTEPPAPDEVQAAFEHLFTDAIVVENALIDYTDALYVDLDASLAELESYLPENWTWTDDYPDEAEARAALTAIAANEAGRVLLGGYGDDTLSGGSKDDIIVGGAGSDTLTGYSGKDLFVVSHGDTVIDFNREDGDMLHIAHLIEPSGKPLNAHVKLEILPDPEEEDNHTRLKIDTDGVDDGAGFKDAVILLKSVILRDSDLAGLWADGYLDTGGVRPALSARLSTTAGSVTEIGGPETALLITFSGADLPDGLAVPLTFTGDAVFGEDFRLAAECYNPDTGAYEAVAVETGRVPIALKPGDRTVRVTLIPTADGVAEPAETLGIALMSNEDVYSLGDPAAATLTLVDGPDRLTIAATGPAAHESGSPTGEVTLSREGTLENPLMVRLAIQGTAVNGSDVVFLPSEIRIPAGEESAVLSVAARTDAETEPEEYLEIFVIQGEGYIVSGPASARVMIVDASADLPGDADMDGLPDAWEARYGLDPTRDDADGDPDGDGFTNLEEYLCNTDPTDAGSLPEPPTAGAGPDRIVAPGQEVALNGYNSVCGAAARAQWRQTAGPAVDLAGADGFQPEFTAPANFEGVLRFELTVETPCGGSASDFCLVNVSASGEPPAASAASSPESMCAPGEGVVLSAEASSDPYGDAADLAYEWRQLAGPEVTLSDAASAAPEFTAPAEAAALLFEVTVTDASGLTDRARTALNVMTAGTPPEAAAAVDPERAEEGAQVQLTGAGGVRRRWRQTGGPPVTLSDPLSASPVFVGPAVGPEGADLQFSLAAWDGAGRLDLAEVTVRILDDAASGLGEEMVPVTTAAGDIVGIAAAGLVRLAAADGDVPEGALFGALEMAARSFDANGRVEATVSVPETVPDGAVWYARTRTGWRELETDDVTWIDDATARLTLTDGVSGDDPQVRGYAIALAPASSGGDDADPDDGSDGGGGGGGCFIAAAGEAGPAWGWWFSAVLLMLAIFGGVQRKGHVTLR